LDRIDEVGDSRHLTTLEWGREFLAAHFAHASSAMHLWLGRELDALRWDRGSKINLIGPRGSAKSTVATFCYVLRAAVEGWEPYIWIVSDTSDQSRTHLDNLMNELVDNAALRKRYLESGARGRHWRSGVIQLTNGVTIESYGTGQRIRGRRRRATRPSLIVCDDLQNDSHISSALQRQTTRRWFMGTLLNAGTPRTNVVNLATALHRDALALELARSVGWTSRTFASIEKWPRNLDLWDEWEAVYCDHNNPDARHLARQFFERRQAEMEDGAVVLWPEVEDLYTLMRMRVEIGRTAFDREKQGVPIDPDLCEWPEEYFGEDIWFDVWPKTLKVRAIALDPSKGRDAGRGDYSAYAMLGIDLAGVAHVEADLARRATPQLVADGAALCRRFRPHMFGVEANQFQELLCGEIASEFRRQGISHVSPSAIHNHASKPMRIRRLGPWLAQHRMRFLRGSPSTRLLVEQLRDFPSGAHDDGPDALEMALRLADHFLHGRASDDGLGDRLLVG
jgi:predicted phage terminase large subunit-like protein